MPRLVLTLVALAVLAATPAMAETSAPYPAVAVKLAEPPGDPSFAAFRGELATIARRRIYAELAALVNPRGFFWERDYAAALVPTRAGVENLAIAIGLERGEGEGWTAIANFAAEPTAAPLGSRPGIICAPARPQFDQADFHALIRATGTDTRDWSYPRHASVPMHAVGSASSAAVATLGPHLVRVLPDVTDAANPARMAWARIAAPSGKTGFVAPGMLVSLSAERLCYRRDVTGRWRIAGFIGRGD